MHTVHIIVQCSIFHDIKLQTFYRHVCKPTEGVFQKILEDY